MPRVKRPRAVSASSPLLTTFPAKRSRRYASQTSEPGKAPSMSDDSGSLSSSTSLSEHSPGDPTNTPISNDKEGEVEEHDTDDVDQEESSCTDSPVPSDDSYSEQDWEFIASSANLRRQRPTVVQTANEIKPLLVETRGLLEALLEIGREKPIWERLGGLAVKVMELNERIKSALM
ncbi:hypothetical protein V5O48_014908 [Marasmius crinis-equi]|uniref:Uncharacterized protein n=1 Tax=Marasmius crinis-equi TaxID=585013 RepID=A0ABR3EVZ4_9AGAR